MSDGRGYLKAKRGKGDWAKRRWVIMDFMLRRWFVVNLRGGGKVKDDSRRFFGLVLMIITFSVLRFVAGDGLTSRGLEQPSKPQLSGVLFGVGASSTIHTLDLVILLFIVGCLSSSPYSVHHLR
ncbi:hypothetical protein HAX54_025661 [Datura stramonium]|uniref:Uncharacterized protein n=1 Tax=Datura stramonium TaxID=4076 RepID=A0ABS8S703_DATST|nr:hypothetical protein [Datura stramonium]